MATGSGARQRSGRRPISSLNGDSTTDSKISLVDDPESKLRKRRQLSPSSLFLSFVLLPVALIAFLLLKRVSFGIPSNDGIESAPLTVPAYHDHIPRIRRPDKNNKVTTKILTAYIEHPESLNHTIKPLPIRGTHASKLDKREFPRVDRCSNLFTTLPVDDYPMEDPFLPWIHDFFPTSDGQYVQFIAQNRRRCDVGKERQSAMRFWEPQMALFQPVPIVQEVEEGTRLQRIRLASSMEEATRNETRFLCQFHTTNKDETYLVFSEYPFNYEYVSYRKGTSSMFQHVGKDNDQFWLSQLLFRCPIPKALQDRITARQHVIDDVAQIWVDVIPIRAPARDGQYLFTSDHLPLAALMQTNRFDLQQEFGSNHYLPAIKDSGRWENLPVCLPPNERVEKRYRLVGCTWSSASYTRRGDAVSLGDTAARLREWIIAHKMFGFDQLVVYDNTSPEISSSPLKPIVDEFPGFVQYYRWPCRVCNNNRPMHPNPGERSSQYAAEASCRERIGPFADWMAFIDTDEYLIPMAEDTWDPILRGFEDRNIHILEMRSSRGKPRVERMEPLEDQETVCKDPVPRKRVPSDKTDLCVGPSRNETFMSVYNCDFIRPPKPDRFKRAMKQIYQPSYVLSHYVHYATVTTDVAKLYRDHGVFESFERNVHNLGFKGNQAAVALNEVTEGALMHARSVLPHETKYASSECKLHSKSNCPIGYVCPATTEFVDSKHNDNVFTDANGNFCNCWANEKVENVYVPRLEKLLSSHNA